MAFNKILEFLVTKMWPGLVTFFALLFLLRPVAEDARCLRVGESPLGPPVKPYVGTPSDPRSECQLWENVWGFPADKTPEYYAIFVAGLVSIAWFIYQWHKEETSPQ